MALLCLADGNSVITEKIYPDRFLHVGELNRMGAHPHKEGPTVVIERIKKLIGAPVMASDLRAWPPKERPESIGRITSTAATKKSRKNSPRSEPASGD